MVSFAFLDRSSLLFLPLSHFFILPTSLFTLITAPFLLLWPPSTTTHLLSARRTTPFHFTRDAPRSDAQLVLAGLGCHTVQSPRSTTSGMR
ncbi:hypothetical protein N7457_007219 [Penicillium paradoxum]|uniref:uncharacterized protein n=1 Tax=Penicillium paradoxum TaxID=176176 RepID=UPI0025482BB9|nr:uncharacterized protein N7457_007219 [Penicillium paradoxum]KAJ5779499.1 hypothetical protein N7457_007219 [Penicillium paradoxum]